MRRSKSYEQRLAPGPEPGRIATQPGSIQRVKDGKPLQGESDNGGMVRGKKLCVLGVCVDDSRKGAEQVEVSAFACRVELPCYGTES